MIYPILVCYTALFIRCDDHTFYPQSTNANYDMVGNNKGTGYNTNFARLYDCSGV